MHNLQLSGLRWTRLCVASTATALFATTASVGAFASRTHTLRHGESLDTLARKYHVSVQDLVEANHIEDQNRIRDGRVLIVPPPPRSRVAPATTHRASRIAKNRVSIRLGPGLDYRRKLYGYEGDGVVVTATDGAWSQVALANGHTGWILTELLAPSKQSPIDAVAARSRKSRGTTPKPGQKSSHAVAMTPEEARKRTAKAVRHRSGETSSNGKRHSEEHPDRVAAQKSHKTSRKSATVAKASHAAGKARKSTPKHQTHQEEVAMSSHRRKSTATHSSKTRHANSDYRTASATKRSRKSSSSTSGSDLVRTAYAYRGTPYVWGGERPGGFDCSGFTRHLYAKKGIDLPHSARAQFEMGNKVDKSGLKPGDLVFFHTTTPGISHVGMYVGNGNFVHASSRRSGGVRVDSLDGSYYSKAYRGARRIKK